MQPFHAIGIIPARYGSTRFPGKPLVDINGKTMIRRVYEQAEKSRSLSHLLVATDDQRICDHVRGFGGNAIMTSVNHRSGTDRCLEAVQSVLQSNAGKRAYDLVINIQGDEPFLDPSQIDTLTALFLHEHVAIGTLVKQVTQASELENPNIVKVILNSRGKVLAFTRAAIPFLRDLPKTEWLSHHMYFKHIGIYGYRLKVLEEIAALPASPLEKAESLEQLRWLENGYEIYADITDYESIAIDSPEDLLELSNKGH